METNQVYSLGQPINFAPGDGKIFELVSSTSTPSPTPASLSDLVVTDVSWSSAPKNGDNVTFSATVKNQGNGATPNGTIVGVLFSINGSPATWSDTHTSSLSPGATVALTANGGLTNSQSFWIAVSGSHTVLANVDDINRIAESNESNNTLSETLNVADSASTLQGDINNSGSVDIFDYNLLLTDFGKTGDGLAGDVDKNGRVDIFDYNLLLGNFGKGSL